VVCGAAAACVDLGPIGQQTLDTSELLILPLQSGAPTVAAASFTVPNGQSSTHQLLHTDAFNTVYFEIRVPAGAFASVNGDPVSPTGSVTITVQPRPGAYGFTLSPSGVEFVSASRPSVLLSFGQYGDFSAADGSPTYPSRVDYLDALSLWLEVSPGRWQRVSGSGAQGIDELGATIREPGSYVVAAPR
jgi:hypothetical protein